MVGPKIYNGALQKKMVKIKKSLAEIAWKNSLFLTFQ
jgi:hypothetical protein